MNLQILYDSMKAQGHTKKNLCEILGITLARLNRKFRTKDSDSVFTMAEIRTLKDYYNLGFEIYDSCDYIEPPSEICERNIIQMRSDKSVESLENRIKDLSDKVERLSDNASSAPGGMTEEYVLEQMKKSDSALFMGIYSTVGYAVYMKIKDEMQNAGVFSVEQRNDILRMVGDAVKSMGAREVSLDEIQPVKSAPGKVTGMVDESLTYESGEDAWAHLHDE